jgi:hypothetical protein
VSRKSVLEFLLAARDDAAFRARYGPRDLTRLVFHARNDGFDFTAGDLADVVGALEADVILVKDGDAFDATSRLWRRMWGVSHLDYVVEHVVRRHTDDELSAGAQPEPGLGGGEHRPGSVVGMSAIEFLRLVGERPGLLDGLKDKGKDDVLAAAGDLGFTFTEQDFDSCVWDAEVSLAQRRGEPFDAQFPLWQTMWGRTYLEYLVVDLVSSLKES